MDRIEAEGLKPFATARQAEYLDAWVAHDGYRAAAGALGVNERTFTRSMQALRDKAARQGYAPDHDMVHTAPNGYMVKGTSTLYTHGEDGQKVAAQWVKTSADQERMREIMEAAIEGMSADLPRLPAIPGPKQTQADLLNLYVVTDYHLGMYSWHKETGADWDMGIAEKLLVDWFSAAIAAAPDSETAILGQLGDFMHWDGLDAVTPTSGHALDADTRIHEVIDVAMRVTRRVIDMLLHKHKHVHIVIAEGNHDLIGSAWLRKFTRDLYENEPRITVDDSVDPYYAYQHGKTALFFHHGHKRNPKNVDSVFAAKFREIFGQTLHAYAHLGHLHHDLKLETNLMTVEQHRTLASPDAYASRGGWMSGRSASVITYHKEHGKVGSVTLTPEMVAA